MADEKKPFDWKAWGRRLLVVVITAAVSALTGRQFAPVPPPVEVPFAVGTAAFVEDPTIGGNAPPPPPQAFGWVDDPAEVKRWADVLPIKAFRDTPAGQDVGTPDRVFHWEYARKARGGKHIPTRNQGQVGSCVAFGAAGAVEYLMAIQIAAGAAETWKDIAQEPIYGGSRVQIGGSRIRGDGSVGIWAAQWLSRYGAVARGTYGSIDLTAYSESRCRQYGDRGCPAELVPLAKERPVKSTAPVRTTAELRGALANGYPATVASTVGFTTTRDGDGVLRASGTWAHQMFVIGYYKHPARGWLYYIMNSWGERWVNGPPGEGDPPPGGFYCEESAMSRILAAGDSHAFSSFTGFPSQRLDWTAVSAPAREMRHNPLFARLVARPSRPEVNLAW